MQLSIEIETSGPLLAFDLLNRPGSLASGTIATIPDVGVVELTSMREQRSADLPTIITVAVTIGANVGASLVASWLYDKIKGRARTVRIDWIEVQLDKGEIQRIIAERLEEKS
jgi:hypothetical protein